MKKLLSLAATALVASALLISCASSGSGSSKKSDGPEMVSSVAHPRTYILDLADSTESTKTTFNANNGIYQLPSHELVYTKYFKYDFPQAGDTIEVHYKGVSDIDLNGLEFYFMDASAAANYWLGLMDQNDIDNNPIALNVKAGEEFEGVISYTLKTNPSKRPALEVVMFYDNKYYKTAGLEKIGKAATIQWLKTDVNTTNTEDELVAAGEEVAPAGPKTMTIDLADASKMFKLEQTAENGQITGYQAIFDISNCFPGDLPMEGDEITVTFKGTSDIDVPTQVYASIVENTQAVGWWREIATATGNQLCVENIVAGEPFELKAVFNIEISSVEGASIQIYYKPTSEDVKSATWTFVRPQ